jgi:glycosyltransferase involved in cell wall biosynthesis
MEENRHGSHGDEYLVPVEKERFETPQVKVFLLCSGLGRIDRGFESFTREFFDAFAGDASFDLRLFKGGGTSGGKEMRLPNIPRNHPWGHTLGRLLKRDSYVVEQITFILSLLPHLVLQRPDIIYFSDGTVGNLLWHWKKTTGATFKLLFSNGGPLSPPFPRWDHIHQVTPANLEAALREGEPAERQSLVPYGFTLPQERPRLSGEELTRLRERLEIPLNRRIVLSVGLVNKSQKRMDYVIEEMARLPEPRPFLFLLGQQDAETPALAEQAVSLLGKEGFAIRTVPYGEVANFYQAADLFVLASLQEGFGRVIVEAMSHGLPCFVHDSENMRYLLGEFGHYGDFAVTGGLARCLQQAMKEVSVTDYSAQQRAAYQRFSWDQLRPEYIKMIRRCVHP